MTRVPNTNKGLKGCQEFREELDALPLKENEGSELQVFLGELSPASREHTALCAECREAAEDVALTRSVLRPLGEVSLEPGPWFATRVMAAIAGRESELDLRDAVWVSIRRLAPRLVAVCALLLVLASTWTYQLRRMELATPPQGSSETVLEPGQAPPLNDDVLINAGEGHR
jgi:hypothetical protein